MSDVVEGEYSSSAAESFAVDSLDPAPREDGQPGPPDNWPYPSYYSRIDNDWWWKDKHGWRPDPCPARPLGAIGGEFIFLTSFGECRRFTAPELHRRSGLSDLFGGAKSWTSRHFTRFDLETRTFKGGVQIQRVADALIRACERAGYYDDRQLLRGPGVWRDPDNHPVLNTGRHVFHGGLRHEPGVVIGRKIYVRGTAHEAPTYKMDVGANYRWVPGDVAPGRIVSSDLDQWTWSAPGDLGPSAARDLFQGALHCNMLGSWPRWLAHVFVQAPYGSGKSQLLHYARNVLGGASHDIQTNYTRAHFEQNFGGHAMAFPVDELERDSDSEMARKIIELARLLSDNKASGGRGGSGGKGRSINVHGGMIMAATVTEEWLPQDRSRITLLEIAPFSDRGPDCPPARPEVLAAMLRRAEVISPLLRARALATVELFQKNLKIVREAILKLGGVPRDTDQLGHLIAGWRTMTSDEAFDADHEEEFARFRPFIISLQETEDGEDEASELLNLLFGLAADHWKGGARRTIGQLIAQAREPDDSGAREDLLSFGLRMHRGGKETWNEAWLLVANKHPGLDELFERARKPRYVGNKRAAILKQLRLVKDGHELGRAVPSERPAHLRFAGTQSRFLQIPPCFLPSLKDEDA